MPARSLPFDEWRQSCGLPDRRASSRYFSSSSFPDSEKRQDVARPVPPCNLGWEEMRVLPVEGICPTSKEIQATLRYGSKCSILRHLHTFGVSSKAQRVRKLYSECFKRQWSVDSVSRLCKHEVVVYACRGLQAFLDSPEIVLKHHWKNRLLGYHIAEGTGTLDLRYLLRMMTF